MQMRTKLVTAGLGAVLALSLAAAATVPVIADEASQDTRIGNNIGYGESGGTTLDNYAEYTEKLTYGEKVAANAEANQPVRYEDSFGFIYQPVPSDPKGWNLTYLNADERGCLSCHTSFEDIVMSLPTKHNVYGTGYPTITTIANCLGCHRNAGFGNIPLSVSIHGIHNGAATFEAMNGSCDSCHYISNGASTPGENMFEMWDYAKYDLFQGITKVAAEDAALD